MTEIIDLPAEIITMLLICTENIPVCAFVCRYWNDIVSKYKRRIKNYLCYVYNSNSNQLFKWALCQGVHINKKIVCRVIDNNDLRSLKYLYSYGLKIDKSMTNENTSNKIIRWLEKLDLPSYQDKTIIVHIGYTSYDIEIRNNTSISRFYKLFQARFNTSSSLDLVINDKVHRKLGSNMYLTLKNNHPIRMIIDRENGGIYGLNIERWVPIHGWFSR